MSVVRPGPIANSVSTPAGQIADTPLAQLMVERTRQAHVRELGGRSDAGAPAGNHDDGSFHAVHRSLFLTFVSLKG